MDSLKRPAPRFTYLVPAFAPALAATAGGYYQAALAEPQVYLSVEQAQSVLLPDKKLSPHSLEISAEVKKQIGDKSGVRWPKIEPKIWKSEDGHWFWLDRVLGKHEDIIYAAAIDPKGKVLGLEILEYRESYGDEVRNEAWRKQFVGKSSLDEIQFNKSIKNISGATLSCRHLTEGVKRFLALYELHLSKTANYP